MLSSNYSLQYCKTTQCKICRLQQLDTDTNFFSNLSHTKYNISEHGSCKTTFCIYMISCRAQKCHMKYIGFTSTKLNKFMSGHRANIINGTEGFVMLNHFTKHHNVTDMVIKPIDICDSKVLRKREQFWIQKLNTIFPYGLNSRIDIEDIHDSYNHIKNNNAKPIYKAFNTVKNNRTKRGSGKQMKEPSHIITRILILLI